MAEFRQQIVTGLQIGFILRLHFFLFVFCFVLLSLFLSLSLAVTSINPSGKFLVNLVTGCNPLSFIQTLCWSIDLEHILPALFVHTPAGIGSKCSHFFPSPPLTLLQDFLGVPGHLPDVQSCLHSDKTEWLTQLQNNIRGANTKQTRYTVQNTPPWLFQTRTKPGGVPKIYHYILA